MTPMPVTDPNDADMDRLIAAAFLEGTPPPPGPAVLAACAVRHAQERPTRNRFSPSPARLGWAAAGLFALVLGCAAGAASQIVAVPGDLDLAFGVGAASGESSAG